MRTKSTNKQRKKEDFTLSLGVSLAIVLGVYLQVGESIYTPNIAVKITGILVPIIISFIIFFMREKDVWRVYDKKLVVMSSLFLLYIFYLVINSSSMGRTIVGTANRNLGLVSISIGAFCFIIGMNLGKSQRKLVIATIILSAIIQTQIVVYQKFLKPDVINKFNNYEVPQVFGSFYNANPLSFFLGIVCSGFFAFILFSKWETKQTLIYLSIIFFLFAGLIWSGSTQGIIGVLIVITLSTLQKCFRIFQRNFSVLLITVYSFSLLTFFLIIKLIPITSSAQVIVNPYFERLEIYKAALLVSSHNFFMGTGLDQFASEYGKYSLSTDLKLVDNAHSIPLQVLSTQGIVGLVFFLSFVFWILSLKPNYSLTEISEWSFWQALFFGYVIVGIIGIDHPVMITISFLAAGILYSVSGSDSQLKTSSYSSRILLLTPLIISLLISFLFFFYSKSEFRTSNLLLQLSQKTVLSTDFDSKVRSELPNIYNAHLLLIIGQAFILTDNRVGANRVSKIMVSKYSDDQRTSVLLFALADKWNDAEALKVAMALRDGLFPNQK